MLSNNNFWLILPFVALIIAFIISWWQSRPINKSALAKRYGVSVDVLMKWVKLFCPAHIVEEYVGSKKQKINPGLIAKYLGSAGHYPKDKKGRIITDPFTIQRAFNICKDSLRRHLKAVENPEQEIGMSLATYKRIHNFPPKYSLLLVNSPYQN